MLEEKHQDLLKKIFKNGIKLNILLGDHDEKDIPTKIKSDETQIKTDFDIRLPPQKNECLANTIKLNDSAARVRKIIIFKYFLDNVVMLLRIK